MNEYLLSSGQRRRWTMFIAGLLIGLTGLLPAAWSPASMMAAANGSCMPANPAFGIFSDELDEMAVDVPSVQPCQVAPAAAPVAQPVPSASEPRHSSLGQVAPARDDQAQSDEVGVWVEVYEAQAHDRVR
jgi:hypothetical protein